MLCRVGITTSLFIIYHKHSLSGRANTFQETLKAHASFKDKRQTYKFHMEDFFLEGLISGCSREARIISVQRTASCSSISLSLYWFLSIRTRAISTRVNRLRWAIGTSSCKHRNQITVSYYIPLCFGTPSFFSKIIILQLFKHWDT